MSHLTMGLWKSEPGRTEILYFCYAKGHGFASLFSWLLWLQQGLCYQRFPQLIGNVSVN